MGQACQLDKMVRKVISEKVTFEHRPGGEGVRNAEIWRNSVSGSRNSEYGSPELGMHRHM